MREYKFRGKRTYNEEWIYGDLLQLGGPCIVLWDEELGDYDYVSVLPDTIGQFTGLKDRNGKEIYEGDLVKFHYFYAALGDNLGVTEMEHELNGVIIYGLYGWAVSAIKGQHWEGYTGYHSGEGESSILELFAMNQSSLHEESFELIGNIYEQNAAPAIEGTHHMTTDPREQGQPAEQPTETQPEVLPDSEEGNTEG